MKTLFIATDASETRWLTYILTEFRRIEGARFDIEVVSVEALTGSETSVLFYTMNYAGSPAVWNSGQVRPVLEVARKESLFVVPRTETADARYALGYDAFWNAFVFLSRLEEWQAEQDGARIRSYASRHPRRDKTTFDIPVVNLYFADVRRVIQSAFPELQFAAPLPAKIEWTHDLDYIAKTMALRLKQTAFNKYNLLRFVGKPEFFAQLRKTWSFFFSTPSYWCFPYWEEVEKKANVRSTFFIYARVAAHSGFRSWLMDPSYDVSSHAKLCDELRRLKKEDFDIGLHGSFDSANDEALLQSEKKTLENALGFEITKSRQHWLRYFEGVTPDIHEELFAEDYTLGWNDRPGFRVGCASAFHPYNHAEQRAYAHLAVPQVLMDSHVFDYGHGEDAAHEIVKRVLETPNARAAVSWHPRTCSRDYGWHAVYERVLR